MLWRRNISFALSLSIARADPRTFDPVYGIAIISSIPWMQPSSPRRPCRARNATSIFADRMATSAGTRSSMTTRTTSWPRASSALATPSPVRREISLSALVPPMITPTRRLLIRFHLGVRGTVRPSSAPRVSLRKDREPSIEVCRPRHGTTRGARAPRKLVLTYRPGGQGAKFCDHAASMSSGSVDVFRQRRCRRGQR
jgi:hypothetical protein